MTLLVFRDNPYFITNSAPAIFWHRGT